MSEEKKSSRPSSASSSSSYDDDDDEVNVITSMFQELNEELDQVIDPKYIPPPSPPIDFLIDENPEYLKEQEKNQLLEIQNARCTKR